MNKSVALVLLVWAISAAAADPMVPQDFAYGRAILLGRDGPVHQLSLPEDVYRRTVHADLRDLRVFNAAGETVPYSVRPPWDEKPSEQTVLRFFPLHDSAQDGADQLSLQIRTDARGAIIGVRNGDKTNSTRRIVAYVLDTSAVKQPMRELVLDWSTGSAGFVAQIVVQASDDLQSWQHWSTSTIAELRHAGQALRRDRISLSDRKAKYLRLSWPSEIQAAALLSVRALTMPARQEPERRWLSLSPLHSMSDKLRFDYDSGGRFPVDRLDLQLSDKNAMVQAVIRSRATEHDPWQVRAQQMFYHLNTQGTTLSHHSVGILRNADRYWQVELLGEGSGRTPPQLKLGWIADELSFLARGEAPFTLAYGKADVHTASRAFDELWSSLGERASDLTPIKATVDAERVLGGEDRLIPGKPPVPWRRMGFWGVLVLGVIVLAWMALGLYREMNSGKNGAA